MFYTKSLVRFISFFLLLALMLAPASAVRAAGVRYAAPSAVGSGDCSSWSNACTLQTALSGAMSGDQIWVKAGVHYPGALSTNTFTLKNGVEIYGGFDGMPGTEGNFSVRDWQTYRTILSGDIDQNDTNTDGNYIAETTADIQGNNAYHVVTGGGTDSSAVLDGFVITAGLANGSFPDDFGGGMHNSGSSPTLTNLTFSGNSANAGGGMFNWISSPLLTNVTFSGNSASIGGGMYNWNTSSPTLTNVTFNGNTATNYGGGIDNNNNSNPTLTNVTFSANSASTGGGMYNDTSNPTLTDVTFSINSATGSGGGMYNGNSNPTLTNVTFSGNSATNGGGMYNGNSNPTLTNVTFSGNSATNGGGMYNNNSNPTLTNVILWGDSAPSGPEINNSTSNPAISYSDIEGCGGSGVGWQATCGTDGGNNIDADPLFVNAAGGNLRLQSGSPAIDAGNNAAVPVSVTTDLDGSPRFVDIPTVPDTGSGIPPIVDMGAYEVIPTTATFSSAGAQDGWILESTETSNTGGSSNATATTFNLGDDASDRQFRTILSFNTASLPDTAAITAVTLQIKRQGIVGTNPFLTHGKILVDIRSGPFGTALLQLTDFNAAASKNNVAQFSNTPLAGNWYSVNLNPTAFAFVNKTGITQFRLRFFKDDNDDMGADYLKFFSGNAAAAYRPVLIIQYIP